jgi:hypothetical protein
VSQGMKSEDVDVAIAELIELTTAPSKVDGLEYSDTTFSETLRCQFTKLLNRLVAMPPHGEPDWHPGSDEKVLKALLIFFFPFKN